MDNFRDSYFNITWDLTKKYLRGTFGSRECWGKQYDTGRGFAVTIVEGDQVTVPSTETVRLKWEKPDRTEGYVTAVVVDNKFLIENIDQMFTVPGSIRADLEIWRGGKIISSATFYVSVEKALAVDAIESSSDFTALQEALGKTDSLEKRFDEAIVALTVDGEVITARDGFDSLNARLNNSDVVKADKTYTDAQLALKADKATTYLRTEIDAKDALKADKTYTDTELAKKADKADAYTKAQVDGKDALKADKTYTDTELAKKADKATTYTKTETDTALATKAGKLLATNLITNGDFSQGTTGWNIGGGSHTISGGKIKLNGNGATVTPNINKSGFPLIVGRKYYIGFEFQSNDLTNDKLVRFEPTPYINIYNSKNLGAGRKSSVFTASSANNILVFMLNGYSNHTPTSEEWIEVGTIIVLDLTATFGAGNEPTKEQMGRLLAEFPNSWFDGTQEILPLKTVNELLSEKANKAQEAWITPTMLNGMTGTIQYRKNEFNRLEFRGDINYSAEGGTAFLVPPSYSPTYSSIGYAIACATDGAQNRLILAYGEMQFGVPLRGKKIPMEGISLAL